MTRRSRRLAREALACWVSPGVVLAGAVLLGGLACFGTPTPLAPGLSGSVGWPHHGVQTGAIELPDGGDGFVRYRSEGGYYWGQPALVHGIEAAAREVLDAFPGSEPLVVGDLSARYGGKISRHQSHRTGRDVDLLWYVTTADGTPVRNPYFIPLRDTGLTKLPRQGQVRLDVAREWTLIRALITSEHFEVQWLYSSVAVEAMVLDYAAAQGEAPELVQRSRDVMLQPPESLPHDDHLHLRIACSPEASVQGCEGGGPHWGWLRPPPALAADDEGVEMLELLQEDGG